MSKVYDESIRMLKEILGQVFKPGEVKVVLFGSRARGDHLQTSDIDLGILPQGQPLSYQRKLALLRERLENSNIPYKVDIVDLSQVDDEFARQALSKGVMIWKG